MSAWIYETENWAFLLMQRKTCFLPIFVSPHTNTMMQWCWFLCEYFLSCLAFWLHSHWDLTHCLCSNRPRLFLPTCWPAQVSPRPRMPLHPQQSCAFGLQLPETDPELLCLCSHAHLHWYAEAGLNLRKKKKKTLLNCFSLLLECSYMTSTQR